MTVHYPFIPFHIWFYFCFFMLGDLFPCGLFYGFQHNVALIFRKCTNLRSIDICATGRLICLLNSVIMELEKSIFSMAFLFSMRFHYDKVAYYLSTLFTKISVYLLDGKPAKITVNTLDMIVAVPIQSQNSLQMIEIRKSCQLLLIQEHDTRL